MIREEQGEVVYNYFSQKKRKETQREGPGRNSLAARSTRGSWHACRVMVSNFERQVRSGSFSHVQLSVFVHPLEAVPSKCGSPRAGLALAGGKPGPGRYLP